MRSRFITSCVQPSALPAPTLPEFAFVGRSNVGKSSLLNALAQARIARISGTPGRTQMINLFEVDDGRRRFVLADLPGYGFAKVPRAIQAGWEPLVDGYLSSRTSLRAVLLLVDLRREPEEDDRAVFSWLGEVLGDRSIALAVVGTKIDKLPKAQQKPALARAAAAFGIDRDRVFRSSASSFDGIEVLRDHLRGLAESPEVAR